MGIKNFSLNDFAGDRYELRVKLFTCNIEERVEESLKFINQNFLKKEKLDSCTEFMDHTFTDCFKAQTRELDKHCGFPSIEATYQFDYAIKHALIGSYKASFDHLRSCLELTLVTVYFAYEKHYMDESNWLNFTSNDIRKARLNERSWFDSSADTPFFSKMLKLIGNQERFNSLNEKHFWFDDLKKHYYKLSDFTHIKGYMRGTQMLNNVTTHLNGSSFHNINPITLNTFLETLIESISHIVVLIALYNPITLIELPIETKFGMNEPIGFIQPGQSELVNHLIPIGYKDFFETLKKSDEEVLGLINWVNSYPDLTPNDWQEQIKSFNTLFKPLQ